MDIDTESYLPICQKTYTLPLKHIKWIWDEQKMSEKAEMILKCLRMV